MHIFGFRATDHIIVTVANNNGKKQYGEVNEKAVDRISTLNLMWRQLWRCIRNNESEKICNCNLVIQSGQLSC